MSRGIFKALTKLKEMIEAIDPKTDIHQGFVCINDGSGLVPPLNTRFQSQRQFAFEIVSLAMDDGSAGLSGRKRVTVEIHVRYAVPKEQGFKIRMMTEDSGKLIDTIKGPQYDFNTTGIVSVIPLQSRAELITDDVGEILGHLLIVPFDLLYLEA
tara:strand:- start:4030 stop:4494 length:465 start_codon:yes stop_codon:yes gene_type:complete